LKTFRFEADARFDFAGRDRSDQSSTGRCRANGALVTDVAILLGTMQSPQADYTSLLRRGAFGRQRIGRDVRFFDYSYYGSGIPGDEETVAFANHALDVMVSLGATIVDTDTGTYRLQR